MSASTEPGAMASLSPPCPVTAARTALPSGSMVTTRSAPAATSAGLLATTAPSTRAAASRFRS